MTGISSRVQSRRHTHNSQVNAGESSRLQGVSTPGKARGDTGWSSLNRPWPGSGMLDQAAVKGLLTQKRDENTKTDRSVVVNGAVKEATVTPPIARFRAGSDGMMASSICTCNSFKPQFQAFDRVLTSADTLPHRIEGYHRPPPRTRSRGVESYVVSGHPLRKAGLPPGVQCRPSRSNGSSVMTGGICPSHV